MCKSLHIKSGDIILSIAVVILCSGICIPAPADNIQPAYLDIEELEECTLRVLWKVPLNQNVPTRFRPSFPDSFTVTSPLRRVKLQNAVIEKWTMVCGRDKLAGATIGIEGLEKTAMDTLVRIEFANGTLHRVVLRPTDRSMTVPSSDHLITDQARGKPSVFRLADRWRYLILFVAAYLLSLTPGARQRGILLCAVVLVVGSLCGQAVGSLPIQEKLFGPRMPSDEQAKRILRGLMLNTYRAFMLDKDDEIYDVLARSVAGEFLTEVYLQNREAMKIDDTRGTSSYIDRLDVKSIESMRRLPDRGIAMVANWDVYGSVRHWNHIHFRCNTYRADLAITPADNYWKLTRVQLLDEERVI
jgi:hypothetical protein